MRKTTGSINEFLIMSVLRKGPNYGWRITRTINGWPGRKLSDGSTYTTLTRIVAKGLATSKWGSDEDRPEARRRYYTLTASGQERLREFAQALKPALAIRDNR